MLNVSMSTEVLNWWLPHPKNSSLIPNILRTNNDFVTAMNDNIDILWEKMKNMGCHNNEQRRILTVIQRSIRRIKANGIICNDTMSNYDKYWKHASDTSVDHPMVICYRSKQVYSNFIPSFCS